MHERERIDLSCVEVKGEGQGQLSRIDLACEFDVKFKEAYILGVKF